MSEHPLFSLEAMQEKHSPESCVAIAFYNLQQHRLQGDVWFANAKENFKQAEKWVTELRIDTSAVVMAAGVSLPCRYKEVLLHYPNATYIAVDRALGTLDYLGIVPEYVVCKDANAIVADYLKTVTPKSKVLVALQCHPSVAQTAIERGCEVYFYGPINPMSPTAKAMYAEFGNWVGMIMEGSVVTFDACDFAVCAGATEVVTVGNDLRFYSEFEAKHYHKAEAVSFGDGSYSTTLFHEATACFNGLPGVYPNIKFVSYSSVPTVGGTEVKLFLDGWENR